MKVLLVNGSPHAQGCTQTALSEVAKALEGDGVSTEIFHIGDQPIGGCVACRACASLGRCGFDDAVNVFLDRAQGADGFVFGSPVHYAASSGSLTGFLDRAFCADGQAQRGTFRFKPGAAVVSARRAGTTAALDQLHKYFLISQMPVVASGYWNMVHGTNPEEVAQDQEGLQTMRMLGRNMAWLLRCKEAGAKAGIHPPAQEQRIRTNFIH